MYKLVKALLTAIYGSLLIGFSVQMNPHCDFKTI